MWSNAVDRQLAWEMSVSLQPLLTSTSSPRAWVLTRNRDRQDKNNVSFGTWHRYMYSSERAARHVPLAYSRLQDVDATWEVPSVGGSPESAWFPRRRPPESMGHERLSTGHKGRGAAIAGVLEPGTRTQARGNSRGTGAIPPPALREGSGGPSCRLGAGADVALTAKLTTLLFPLARGVWQPDNAWNQLAPRPNELDVLPGSCWPPAYRPKAVGRWARWGTGCEPRDSPNPPPLQS